MLLVTFTIPRDTPAVELWDDDTEHAELYLRAKHHRALYWTAEPYQPQEEDSPCGISSVDYSSAPTSH